ncbi:hypothetical protein ACFUAC_21620 [Streptomyces sp. NPDC057148]|uniref:hypothetical protein n=1 Tax=unclassified Streptomyces TaxID=2593676 RepID=UPI0036269007
MFCVDEKPQIQALDRSQPVLPMMPGVPHRLIHDYMRSGTATLFAALEVATGKVIGSLHRRHRAKELKKFLIKPDLQIPADLDVRLVTTTPPIRPRRSRPARSLTPASTCTSPPPDRPGSTW